MDEQASFEPKAVLAPRRAGWNRFAIAVPALALAAIAWAGASGAGSDRAVAESPHLVAVAAPSIEVVASPAVARPPRDPRYPAQVVGLDVQRLDVVQAQGLGRDTPIAVAGWYVATAIADCPPLAALYRTASLPELRGDADEYAFCVRSGVLYASRLDFNVRLAMDHLEGNRSREAGLPAVAVTLEVGVVVPPELELIGGDATPVVVVGHFVHSGGGCGVPAGCARELVVDHLAWAAGL
jgi:hypothetical protein